MAHGLNSVLKRGATAVGCRTEGKTGMGSRRIFAPHFKLQVLDSYRNDPDCKGNQRATARKYGIHRRQIQKWLQVEVNLRNSVAGKGRPQQQQQQQQQQGPPEGEQPSEEPRGSAATEEARVPALVPPVPLDYTTHGRGSPRVASPAGRPPSPVADPAAPIDLSLKRPAEMAAGAPSAPATRPAHTPPRPLPSPSGLARPHPDVWDLSTKRKHDESPTATRCSPRPFKLFKPYLNDAYEESAAAAPIKTEPLEAAPPCCGTPYFYHHDNNNICDVYTLHELQPNNPTGCFYYTLPASYHSGVEYETAPCCVGFDDSGYGHGAVVPLKQRHSYSLDFKLSAIECYYQDTVCKGNQRAVATKYNIHRRQVQKWLKQADELKQRNDSVKHTQTVR